MQFLRKFSLLAVVILAFSISALATINSTTYPFTTTTGVALEDMSTGTTQLVAASQDDTASTVTNIGFTFPYDGTNYTQFSVNSNGWMRLGSVVITGSSFSSNSTYTDLNGTSDNPKLTGIGYDQCTRSNGKIHYKVVGSAPSRKLVVEYLNLVNYSSGCTAGTQIKTYQIWLSETSGRVDFVYGGNSTLSSYAVGLAQAVPATSSGFASVTTSANTVSYTSSNEANTAAIAAGRQYSFNAPVVAPGSIQFSGTSYSGAESLGASSLPLTRTGGSLGAVSVSYAFTDGTATGGAACDPGIDYINTGGTVNFADGVTSGTVPVTLCSDTAEEPTETFTVTLSNPTGGATLGANNPATVNVINVIASFPYTQDFETNNGGYSAGVLAGSATDWQYGTPAKTQITGAHSGTKAWVTKQTGNYTISTTSTLTSPVFNFSSLTSRPTLSFWHNFKTEAAYDAGIVEYSIDGGTTWTKIDATLGTGATFNTTNSTYWYNNSSTNGSATGVTQPKFSNTSTAYTGATAGYIQSTSILPAAVVGQANVRLRWTFGSDSTGVDEGWAIDDISIVPPSPGTIQFSSTGYTAPENFGTGNIPLTRTGGSLGAVSVSYAFTDGTATGGAACDPGIDYINTGGTVNFADGVTSGTVPVTLCTDSDTDPGETFTVTLSNPTGGVVIGANNPATITITDVAPPFSGNINVGAGNNYTSLTNAGGVFEALNNSGVSGDVTINITSDLTTETGAVALSQLSGTSTVTISPSGGAPRVISGSNTTTGLLVFNGADRVNINGLNTGGNSLIIRNTGAGAAILYINDASNNTLQNSQIEGGNGVTLINISTGTTTGNDNIQIINNIIRDQSSGGTNVPFNAVGSTSASTTITNSNLLINNNQIFNFTQAGVFVGVGTDNITVTNNNIYQTAARTTALIGIAVNGTFGTNLFSQNQIHDLATTAATTGMVFNDARGTTVSRNNIYNFPSTSGSTGTLTGIVSNGNSGTAASVTIVNNFISIAPSFTNAQIIYGIEDFGYSGNVFTSNFNTVLIGGTGSGSSNSYACVRLFSAPTTHTSTNNICFNNRTGGTGNKFAAGDESKGTGTFVSNYNIYVGTGATAANLFDLSTSSTVTPVSFTTWKAGTPTRDANAQASNPTGDYTVANMFESTSDLRLKAVITNPALSSGNSTGTGVTTDYDADPRDTVPDIGADEVVQGTGGTIAGGTYNNVFPAANTTLGGDTTVTGNLTLNGVVNGGEFTLTLGQNATVTRNSGYVAGKVSKLFPVANGQSFEFPVGTIGGTDDGYTPVNLTNLNVSAAGDGLAVTAFDQNAPGNPGAKRISRYWQLDQVNGAITTDLTFNYLPAEALELDASTTDRRVFKSGVSTCTTLSVCSYNGNSATITNVNSFSPWTVAQLSPTAASVEVAGRVKEMNGRGINRARVMMTDVNGNVRMAFTNQFGYYRFSNVPSGSNYIFSVAHRRYQFAEATQVQFISEDMENVNFTATGNNNSRPEATFFDNAPFDFDGDGRTDIAVFRQSNNTWYIKLSQSNTLFAQEFGAAGDRLVPADFDGDGKTDLAVFRPAEANWYIWSSASNSLRVENFGADANRVIPADFDGDGKADLSVWNELRGTWQVKLSTTGEIVSERFNNGKGNFDLLAFDRDGDGKADFAFFNQLNGTWTIRTRAGAILKEQFGQTGDRATLGDFDGDGLGDLAVFRQSENAWFIKSSNSGNSSELRLSSSATAPVSGDFDGDGRFDAAGFGNGIWSIRQSLNDSLRQQQFGLAEDILIPSNLNN